MSAFVKLPNGAIGCNIEQMTSLSQQFRSSIEQLEGVFKSLDSNVGKTTWSGPDATKAEGEWNQCRTQTMNNLRQLMEALSTAIANHASQQTSASA